MNQKFPRFWGEQMGSSCYDEKGDLTAKALTWMHELASLPPEMIKTGLRDLSYLKNPEYPPSAIVFVKHCRERFSFSVVSEVMDYISHNDKRKWRWSGLVAFNVYLNLHYNHLGNETQDQLRSRIEKVYNGLAWHDLEPLPDYSLKKLPVEKDDSFNSDPGYRQFCGRVANLITANTKGIEDWAYLVDKFFPDLTRKFWLKFKASGMKVSDFLRTVGWDFPVEPADDDVVQSIISRMGL